MNVDEAKKLAEVLCRLDGMTPPKLYENNRCPFVGENPERPVIHGNLKGDYFLIQVDCATSLYFQVCDKHLEYYRRAQKIFTELGEANG